MSGLRQGWLVALREMRERSRSRGFRSGLAVMLLVVVVVIVVPAMLKTGPGAKDVGVTGAIPDELPRAISGQGDTVGMTVRVHRFDEVAAGYARSQVLFWRRYIAVSSTPPPHAS
jgi:ABC-2 type transport system permease protein